MKRLICLSVVLCLVAAQFAAAAELATLEQLDARLAQLESELAAARQSQPGLPAASCSCDCNCGNSCDCLESCCPCQPTGLYGGAELVFAKPFLKESFRASIFNVTGVQTLLPFDYDYVATPRVWLGYVGAESMGVRASYWRLSESQGPENFVASATSFPSAVNVNIIFPSAITTTAPGEVLSVSNSIELETLDLEGTLHFDGWGNRFVASAGLEYGRISQDYHAIVTAGGVPQQVLNWDRQLAGVGPTVGLSMRRPIGCSGLEALGAFQLAILFGEKDIHRFSLGGPSVPLGGLPRIDFDDASEMLLVGRIQLGAQYTREIAWGGEMFLRATYEGQVWTDSGGNALGYLGVQGFGLAVGLAK